MKGHNRPFKNKAKNTKRLDKKKQVTRISTLTQVKRSGKHIKQDARNDRYALVAAAAAAAPRGAARKAAVPPKKVMDVE